MDLCHRPLRWWGSYDLLSPCSTAGIWTPFRRRRHRLKLDCLDRLCSSQSGHSDSPKRKGAANKAAPDTEWLYPEPN